MDQEISKKDMFSLFLDYAKSCKNVTGSYGTLGGVSLNQWCFLKEHIDRCDRFICDQYYSIAPISVFRMHVFASFFHDGYTNAHHHSPQCEEHWREWKAVTEEAVKDLEKEVNK